ncbi:Fic family protein [Aminipila sp.]|uniref:Fic family protein n=1 Tax=Aminipila sp. TaxID=2060095 RepID=UPI001D42BB20|nr:Fic family protein [Aminipila sp.]MBE6034278.1 Fic family protein [Clostridiales bacterium]
MYQDILKKKKILDDRKPYSIEMRQQIKKMDFCELIYTSLHLDGSIITKEQVRRILEGEFVVEGTVEDHQAIENYIETLFFMENLMEMESDISLKILEDIHDVSCGTEGPIWRRNNPILYTLDYNPPHWQDIKELMNELIRWTYSADQQFQGNKLLKAAHLHNKLIEIYPFQRNSESTARLAMYYSLMRDGYPIFELRLSESEYNNIIIDYLKYKKIEPFYKAIERGVFNKLDVILQLTAETEE